MRRIFFSLIIFIILSGQAVYACSDTITGFDYTAPSMIDDFPEIESSYIVLMDADSGEVLYQNNGNAKCHPASTTKLLTALLAIEDAALTDNITYSKAAVNSITYGDANASISEGEVLTLEQSLYCLLLRSANDVAYGLAEYIGTTISGFSSMMNERAAELGALNTHFTNPSGLTDEFHYTTPYDMALIGRACFNNKTLMGILNYSGVYTINKTNKSNFIRYYTHRYQMIKGGIYEYPYSCGGKTGYTDAAGNCLVSFAEKDGIRLICSIMNSSDDGRYKDTIALFDYYFNNYKKIYLDDLEVSLNSGIDFLDTVSGLSAATGITVGFESGAYLLVPDNVTESTLTSIVTYAGNPAYSGKDGGFACISYYSNGISLGNATIYARTGTADTIPGTNGVPLYNISINPDIPKVIYINIWFVMGFIVFIALVITFIIARSHHKRKRFGFTSQKKLHF